MRFLVHPTDRVTPEHARRAYFCGPDRFLWQSQSRLLDGELLVERSMSDSGYFSIPWMVEERGERTLTTGWLMERERPYLLSIELARGKLNQVRNQLLEWKSIGLSIPPELKNQMRDAMKQFTMAMTSQHDLHTASQHAERAIVMAVDAADMLGTCYAQQALAARIRHATRLETQLAVTLGGETPGESLTKILNRSFNSAVVPINWRQIEAEEREYQWELCDEQLAWTREHIGQALAGPLLSFEESRIPDWLCLWEGDFENLASCVADFVTAAVQRYKGQFDLWHCSARVNTGTALALSPEQRLKLAVYVVELTRSHDPRTPLFISFDQPWAEYMNQEETDPPLYVADTLIRAGLGLSGVGLEINLGYYPGGTYPRDLLEFSQLIDHWSLLGVPLYLLITFPSNSAEDSLATQVKAPLSSITPEGCTPELQKVWTEKLFPLLLAKPYVHGILWNQLSDEHSHNFAHGGLIAADHTGKPMLTALANLRKKFLK